VNPRQRRRIRAAISSIVGASRPLKLHETMEFQVREGVNPLRDGYGAFGGRKVR